jgi:predicted nucleotide-binding protein
MKVFISFAGETSRRLASVLRDWLPQVLQEIEPWLASEDITAGSRWRTSIDTALAESAVAIICVTPENVRSASLAFEAGAASRAMSPGDVIPIVAGIPLSDLPLPLAQFQAVTLEPETVGRLVSILNQKLDRPHPEKVIRQLVDVWWPSLESALHQITSIERVLLRTERELIEETVETTRTILQRLEDLEVRVTQAAESSTPLISETPSSLARGRPSDQPPSRPRLFIGSSSEGLSVAEAIQEKLDDVAECTVWNQAVFAPSLTAIEGLVAATREYDFAAIVMTADDTLTKRGVAARAPRDNLVFELGLFTGALGRARTFLVKCKEDELELPSDLSGVTTVAYRRRTDGNLLAAVAPVCRRIAESMGVRRDPPTVA